MIRISIITVTYNAEKVLKRTLQSVQMQTWSRVEHLIIDGASKDKTIEIANDYKEQSPHEVVILSEPDRGIYDAMNKGLRMATGDYVIFLNAGDCLHSHDTLLTVAESISRTPVSSNPRITNDLPAVIYGNTDIVDDEGRFLFHRHLSAPKHLTWRSFRNGMLVCHQAFYARRDIAADVQYNLAYRYSADVDWCIRVMKEAERRGLALVDTNAVLADYLKEGQTTQNHRASLKERFIVMKRHYGLFTTMIMHLWFLVRNLK
ncbi:MAG: glycosyltransferase [Prevotella sp.]|nr:glycosyltransferase [Prevotella sp.]